MRRPLLAASGLLFVVPAAAGPGVEEARAALKGMAGLAKVAAGPLVAEGSAFRVTGGSDGALQIYLVNGPGGSWQAVLLPGPGALLSAEKAWPGAREAFGDARLAPAAVVVSTADGDLATGGWPAPLKEALAPFGGGRITVRRGVNGLVKVSLGSTGALAQVKRGIGLGSEDVLLRGSAGPELLGQVLAKSGLAEAEGPAQPVPYALSVTFPTATPAPFATLGTGAPFGVTFRSTQLSLEGQGSAVTLSGTQKVELRINGKPVALDTTLTFQKSGPSMAIACQGAASVEADLLGTAAYGFTLQKVTLGGELSSDVAPGGRKIQGFGLSVGAQVKLGNGPALQGDFAVALADGKVTELSLILQGLGPHGLSLKQLPGFKSVPGADSFAFRELGIGVSPANRQAFLLGSVLWPKQNLQAEAVVLLSGTGQALFLKAQGLTLRKLVPTVPAEADALSLDRAVLVLSSGTVAPGAFPGPVRAMIESVTGRPGGAAIANGLTVLTAFTPTGGLKDTMGLVGMGADPIVLTGSLGGVFQGDPSFSFSADLGRIPLPPSAQPGFIRPRSLAPKFFIEGQDLKSAPTLAVGVDLAVGMQLGQDQLELGLKTFATLGQAGPGLRATGTMAGVWHNPLGLQGLDLSDVKLGLGFDASSTVSIALGGSLRIDGLPYTLNGVLGVMATTGAPTRLGLAFTGKELSVMTQLKLMDSFVGAAANGPLASAIRDANGQPRTVKVPSLAALAKEAIPVNLVKVRDVKLFLATPGVHEPDMPGLNGMGIGVKGTLILDGKVMGSIDSAVSEVEGLRLAGNISDLDFSGLVALKGARIDLRVPVPPQGLPSFKLKGAADVLRFKGDLDVELSAEKAKFKCSSDWGAFGHADFRAESIGPDLMHPRDFILELNASADLKNGVRKQLGPAITDFLGKAAKEDSRRLAEATAELAQLKENLASVRKAAEKNQAKATDAVAQAEKAVDKWARRKKDVNADIKAKKKALNKAKEDLALDRAADLGLQLGALYVKREGIVASHAVAKETLKRAKQVTGAVPVDLYPEVVEAQAEVNAKQAEVTSIQAGSALNGEMSKIAEAIRTGAGAIPVAVEEFSFRNGKMSEAIKGRPQTVTVKLKVTLPKRPAFRLTEELDVNVMNPMAMDLVGLAEALRDAIQRTSRALDEDSEGIELL